MPKLGSMPIEGAMLEPTPPPAAAPDAGAGVWVLASAGLFFAIIKRDKRRVILVSVLRF